MASGGMMVNFLGSQADRSLEASSAILEEYNLLLHKITPYILPHIEKERHLLILKKIAP
jgi:16S rRNA G527 N7-methylase RsmG